MRRSPLAQARGPRTEPLVVGGVLAALVALLVTFGVLAVRQGLDGGEDAAGQEGREGSAPQGESDAVPNDVLGLLPHGEGEIRDAAHVAAGFVEQYATIDPAESADERMERLRGDVSDDFAERLEQMLASSPASGSAAGSSTDGEGADAAVRAEASVHGIRSVGETSVVFLVTAAEAGGSAAEGEGGLQEYAATVAREDDRWLVYDVQFADVGDGDGSVPSGGAP